MAGFLNGALSKMTIYSLLNADSLVPVGSFSAMYNPDKISISHSNSADGAKELVLGKDPGKFLHRNPRSLKMELFFDGTEVSPSAIKGGGINAFLAPDAVDLQIKQFLEIAYNIDGISHRPRFLVFVWGSFIFPGVLESADVSYTLFSSDGRPLRARVSITVKEAASKKKALRILNLMSPDLTHSRIVKEGDTLYGLAHEMYGDASLYMELARVNNLKNYRKLTPGQSLVFPPIDKLN